MGFDYKKIGIGCSILVGFSFASEDLCDYGIPVIKIGNLHNRVVSLNNSQFLPYDKFAKKHEKFALSSGDILIAMTGQGSVGRVGRINNIDNKKVLLNQRVGKFVINEKIIDANYLYSVLSTDRYEKILFSMATGSGQPNLSPSIIEALEIPLPNIIIQQKIGKILLKIDKKIELNNQMNYNLQEIARNLFANQFSSSKLNAKLKNLVERKKKNINPTSKNTLLNYFPVDMLPMNYLITKAGKNNEEAKSSLIEFKKYDILLGAMRVYFHRVCLAAEDGITRNTAFVLTPKNKKYLVYALLVMDRNEFIDYASKTSKGSTMPYAVWENGIAEYDIYMPTEDETEKFNEILMPLLEKMITSEKENRELEKLRNTLLPRLLNGEVNLDKIEV